MTPCNLGRHQRFRGINCLHLLSTNEQSWECGRLYIPLHIQGRNEQRWKTGRLLRRWKGTGHGWMEYLVNFWTRADLTATVWKQGDVYILTRMHPTKKGGSSHHISDLYLRSDHLKSWWTMTILNDTVFCSPARQMPGWYFNLDHDHFLLHPIIIHKPSYYLKLHIPSYWYSHHTNHKYKWANIQQKMEITVLCYRPSPLKPLHFWLVFGMLSVQLMIKIL
jgi:hypothetical protein